MTLPHRKYLLILAALSKPLGEDEIARLWRER
jgi:hypothetical protein